MLQDYYEIQRSHIESDLASFADPGTVSVTNSGSRFLNAAWMMREEFREATFRVSQDSGITVTIDGKTRTYRAFLANTQMADLRHMAQMIMQTASRDIFVPTKAHRTDADTGPYLATELLADLLGQHDIDLTQVLMVTGEAGAGKTRVLQELVRQQAERYLQGQTETLLLYVNAQGRALSRLNEALATELQDLKVNLTYHSVATLARVGLLVPVIDGFDELLGVSGYDDAFNSLAAFLEQLAGEGRLVASARSVYYEEEFLSRAGKASATGKQAWSYVPVRIVPWEYDDQKGFVDALAKQKALPESELTILRERVNDVFRNQKELASKPLFFARTVDLLLRDSEFSGGDDLLGTLAHRFLEREQQEKLLDRQHKPLLSENRLEELMGELAQEMWNQETRELDRGSVREVAEYILDDSDVPESARQIVVERMPTLAFLAPSDKHASILFEHEIFFFYFLARSIVQQYEQKMDMRVILSRSPLPEFVADRLAFELQQQGRLSSPEGLQEILDRLCEAGRTEWRRTTQVRENAGLIVMALLRLFVQGNRASIEIEGRNICTVVFPGGHLRNVTMRDCKFVSVEMRRTDLESTKFIDCSAHDVLLYEPKVKIGSTRLELDGLQVPAEVIGIQERSREGEGTAAFYSPERISRVLRECGAQAEMTGDDDIRNVSEEMLELLEKLMRIYGRANPVCVDDDTLQRLFGDPRWPKLRELLVEHGIVKPENRPTSGSSKEFLRRQFSPDEIMSGVRKTERIEPQIARFWNALETVSA